MNLSQVLGMPKKDAQNFAEMNNLIFRLMYLDGEIYLGEPEPEDVRNDRLCVKIAKGKVIDAEIK
jgi:hypothetical protein